MSNQSKRKSKSYEVLSSQICCQAKSLLYNKLSKTNDATH